MEMIQTYQGYFEEGGKFIPDSLTVKIPTKRRAIVNILDDEVTDSTEIEKGLEMVQSLTGILDYDVDLETARAERIAERDAELDTIEQILSDALKVENELNNADWEEMLNLRKKTNAGLSRRVNL